jgi:hypothetical protein
MCLLLGGVIKRSLQRGDHHKVCTMFQELILSHQRIVCECVLVCEWLWFAWCCIIVFCCEKWEWTSKFVLPFTTTLDWAMGVKWTSFGTYSHFVRIFLSLFYLFFLVFCCFVITILFFFFSSLWGPSMHQ